MKTAVGTIVRVNEKGWREWHSPPVGLIGVIVEALGSDTYAIDFMKAAGMMAMITGEVYIVIRFGICHSANSILLKN